MSDKETLHDVLKMTYLAKKSGVNSSSSYARNNMSFKASVLFRKHEKQIKKSLNPLIQDLKTFYPKECLMDIIDDFKCKTKPIDVFENRALPMEDPNEEGLSVDVLTVDKENQLGVAYYSYNDNKWVHLIEDVKNFKWMYKPEQLEFINKY